MRAGRPRSRGCRPDGEVGGIRRATSLKAGLSPLGNSRFACEPGARPPPLGRSIEKDYKLNIDAQDAQDNQAGRLLQETLTRAMIVCGFEDVREHKPAVSGKNPVHPVHPCEFKNLPVLDVEPVSSHPAQGVVSDKTSGAPALPGRSSEGETGLFQTSRAPAPHDGADHSRVKQRIIGERIGTWRDSGSYAPFELWCPVPQDKSGSEQAIIH